MSAAVPLREDFHAADLRRLAKVGRDAGQSRRLLALAEIDDGASRMDAARIRGVVGLQTVRDWVLAFNAKGPAGLIDGTAPGHAPKLNDAQRRALAAIVERGPDPDRDGVVRWRRKDLAAWLYARFHVSLDETTIGRELRKLGFAKLSGRPRHSAQDPATLEAFKKSLPATVNAIRTPLPPGTPIELWWQDEARVGQKNTLTRLWARRGTRPRLPQDQRTQYADIFGAICPEKGKGAGLVLPRCNARAMNEHLIEISRTVDPGAYAVLMLDGAGWHSAGD